MNTVIGVMFGVVVTPWKLIGYRGRAAVRRPLGGAGCSPRASAASPTMPRTLLDHELSGSALLLSYFIWGKNDSVGVLSNLFPAAVALYNLILDVRAGRAQPSWLSRYGAAIFSGSARWRCC